MSEWQHLINQVDRKLAQIERLGADAFRAREYAKAEALAKLGEGLGDVRQKLAELQQMEKEVVYGQVGPKPRRDGRPSRAPKGSLTPVEAYCVPILQVLVERGGAATVGEVSARVYELMRDRLNEYDLLEDGSGCPRWKLRVQLARTLLVKRGLLRKDSPRGVWEITERGRKFVEESAA